MTREELKEKVEEAIERYEEDWIDMDMLTPLSNIGFTIKDFLNFLLPYNKKLYDTYIIKKPCYEDESGISLDNDEIALNAMTLIGDICNYDLTIYNDVDVFVDFCMSNMKIADEIANNIDEYLKYYR